MKIYEKKEMAPCELFEAVKRSFGSEVKSASIYTGSESHKRKYTVLARLRNGVAMVLKVADTPAGMKAIEHETQALQALAKTPLGEVVPFVWFAESLAPSCVLQVQSLLPASERDLFPGNKVSDEVISLLRQLAAAGRRDCRLIDSGIWSMLRDEDLPGQAAGRLRSWLETMASVTVPCSLCHGDFAPWNIRCHGRGLLLYDWEDAADNFPVGIDLFHFMFRRAALLGPWPDPSAFVKSYAENLGRIIEIAAEDVFPVMCAAILREYVLIENKDYRRIDELAGYLAELLRV